MGNDSKYKIRKLEKNEKRKNLINLGRRQKYKWNGIMGERRGESKGELGSRSQSHVIMPSCHFA